MSKRRQHHPDFRAQSTARRRAPGVRSFSSISFSVDTSIICSASSFLRFAFSASSAFSFFAPSPAWCSFQGANNLLLTESAFPLCLSPRVENRLTSKRGHFRGAGHLTSPFRLTSWKDISTRSALSTALKHHGFANYLGEPPSRGTHGAATQNTRTFTFTQGQYLTLRHVFDGQDLRRSYSICAGLDGGVLQVAIKRVDGGAFSTWANDTLAPGDVIDAMPPMGRFHTPIDSAAARHYLAFAAGSGITPVLSIVKTTLAREPRSQFTLVYANRQISSILFREDLEDLKNTYLGRLSVLHVLGTDAQEIDLFTGRIDAAKLRALFAGWIDPARIDTAFICGPEPLMQTIAASLRDHGLTEDQIKYELFGTAQPGRALTRSARPEQAAGAVAATVTLDGTTRRFTMPKAGQSLLEAALSADFDAPFSCRAGVCSTCCAKVLEGEVEMMTNHAPEDYEVRAGYVLTCQCYPLSTVIVWTYGQ